MKTNELSGIALDWAVAKCEEFEVPSDWLLPEYNPSTNWQLSGAIIEREGITLRCGLHGWDATMHYQNDDDERPQIAEEQGTTPLIAAMRCYVASKLGDEVEIPEGLYETT
jgi:hypothetical protein